MTDAPARPPVTRLAPSPTGALHLGNARSFLLNWLMARQGGWRVVLRIDDLDGPRLKAGADRQAIDDLAWLGLDWDEGPVPPVGGPPRPRGGAGTAAGGRRDLPVRLHAGGGRAGRQRPARRRRRSRPPPRRRVGDLPPAPAAIGSPTPPARLPRRAGCRRGGSACPTWPSRGTTPSPARSHAARRSSPATSSSPRTTRRPGKTSARRRTNWRRSSTTSPPASPASCAATTCSTARRGSSCSTPPSARRRAPRRTPTSRSSSAPTDGGSPSGTATRASRPTAPQACRRRGSSPLLARWSGIEGVGDAATPSELVGRFDLARLPRSPVVHTAADEAWLRGGRSGGCATLKRSVPAELGRD